MICDMSPAQVRYNSVMEMKGNQNEESTDTADVPGLPEMLRVPASAEGEPLLLLVYARVGVEEAERLFAYGGVWLGHVRVRNPAQPAPAGGLIKLFRPPDGCYVELVVTQDDICYEDGWLLVVNKRPGWCSGFTPWDVHNNVRAALPRFLLAREGVVPPLHMAHQLDRGTSGLLIFTKERSVNAPLQAAFAGQFIEKRYLCVCAGQPAAARFEMRTGHGRRWGGKWGLYPLEQVGALLPNGSHVRLAHTSFVVEQLLAGGAALLRATLHTGRTHQIRLHLAAAGHPLLGDTRYGGPATFQGSAVRWPLLHAGWLRFTHPATGVPLEIAAPLPAPFAALVTCSLKPGAV